MRYVKDIMSYPVVSVTPNTTIQKVAKVMAEKNIGSVAVCEGEKLVGIFTERDLSKKIVAQNKNPTEVIVSDMMARDIITSGPQTSVDEAATIMSEGNFRRLPIVENGNLLGMVTVTDLEIALREEALAESKARVKDHYKFSEQIRKQEERINTLKDVISELEKKIMGPA